MLALALAPVTAFPKAAFGSFLRREIRSAPNDPAHPPSRRPEPRPVEGHALMERRNRADAGGGGPRRGAVTGDQPTSRAVWVRLVIFVVIVAAAGTAAGLVGLPDLEQLRTGIASAGPAAPALFVLLYAVATLAPVPKNVLATVAGVLFGLVLGIVVVLLAALLGALAAFALGRALGRDAVERITGAQVARLDALLHRRGLLAIIGVRLIPVLPFTAINYAAGLTGVRTRDYLIGTALGIIPGAIAFVALGTYGTSPGSWPFILAVIVLVVITTGGAALARRSAAAVRPPRTAQVTRP